MGEQRCFASQSSSRGKITGYSLNIHDQSLSHRSVSYPLPACVGGRETRKPNLVASLPVHGNEFMLPFEFGRELVLEIVANRRSKREDLTAVARPVVEEIGVACQLSACSLPVLGQISSS